MANVTAGALFDAVLGALDSSTSAWMAAHRAAVLPLFDRAAARITSARVPTIHAAALHPYQGDKVTLVRRQASYMLAYGTDWPAIEAGDIVAVEDSQGWRWPSVRILSIEGTGPNVRAEGQVLADRQAIPMPPPDVAEDGKLYLYTPNIGGHAHARWWRTGDIVRVDGVVYRATDKTRPSATERRRYMLTPSTEAAWATRPGRFLFGSEAGARAAIGSAVQTPSGEWLLVAEVKHVTTRAQFESRTWYGHGKHVPGDKAAKVNAAHPGHISRDLSAAHGTMHPGPMPDGAAVLIVGRERVAIVGGAVLHERMGDPDQLGAWRPYVVRVDADADLKRRVAAHIKRA